MYYVQHFQRIFTNDHCSDIVLKCRELTPKADSTFIALVNLKKSAEFYHLPWVLVWRLRFYRSLCLHQNCQREWRSCVPLPFQMSNKKTIKHLRIYLCIEKIHTCISIIIVMTKCQVCYRHQRPWPSISVYYLLILICYLFCPWYTGIHNLSLLPGLCSPKSSFKLFVYFPKHTHREELTRYTDWTHRFWFSK